MFKKIPVELKGFRNESFFLKELSIAKLKKVMAVNGDDLDTLLEALKYSLEDDKGNKVVSESYSIEQLTDDLPQSYLNDLAEAYAELSAVDEIDVAKKS